MYTNFIKLVSLRTSPQTGVAISCVDRGGFPRQCVHWLGMTDILTNAIGMYPGDFLCGRAFAHGRKGAERADDRVNAEDQPNDNAGVLDRHICVQNDIDGS